MATDPVSSTVANDRTLPSGRRFFHRLSRALPALLLLVLAAPTAAAPITEIHYTMGTYFSITIDGSSEPAVRPLIRRCFTEARRLESVFSLYDPASELSRLNARNGQGAIAVSTDLADLLQRSLKLGADTDGAFDVTIGALTQLWRTTSSWPPETVATAMQGDAGTRVRLAGHRLVSLASGVDLDFDGVAKGYAVDRCVTLLRASGITRALLSLGESSQYALGRPMGAKTWKVTVRDLTGDSALGTLELSEQALSVSAVFGHERRIGNRRMGHIIDPRTGEPLVAPASVVVVAESATAAEAWSKALLMRGPPSPPSERKSGRSRGFSGALRITPSGVQPLGKIAFKQFESPRPIRADQEPLR